eukprot:TRINITY_DN6326_c0_g1_i4.p1 TRINITY_DN6326_c0_g1~~TRINITY_DN6326_c0_g1_i4.p1  ORF type:complete len:123 (-),score=8.61 TRINITY_DN6326_c0_g1_i4:53-421(-)
MSSLSDEARYVIANKLNYYSLMNILYMAYCEGQEIGEVDEECRSIIKDHHENMLFLYGRTDNYTPLSYYEDLLTSYPNGNIELAEEGVKHAFVLRHSDVVAAKVHDFLVQAMSKKVSNETIL